MIELWFRSAECEGEVDYLPFNEVLYAPHFLAYISSPSLPGSGSARTTHQASPKHQAMAYPQRLPRTNLPTTLLTLTILFTTPANALSVAKKAAIGISVGFGSLLMISLAAILYLKCSPKQKAERRARREAQGDFSSADAIEFHARENQRQWNVWDYDHNTVMAKKKALKEQRQANQHGPVETVA